ncbi:hypothetical protein H8E88_33750 [candidate division KSB1 bacterium]|nr:hypothetical protein [candidate division KSB1 bacterium]
MKKEDLEYFKSFIIEKRQEVLQSKRMFVLDPSDTPTKVKDLNDNKHPIHMAEQGSDTMEKELNSYFNERTEK